MNFSAFHSSHGVLVTNLPSVLAIVFWLIFCAVTLAGLDVVLIVLEKIVQRRVTPRLYIAAHAATFACLIAGGVMYHQYYVATMTSDIASLVNLTNAF